MSMKNSNDTIGNRIHDFPACSSVPHPTARMTPRASSGFPKKQQFLVSVTALAMFTHEVNSVATVSLFDG